MISKVSAELPVLMRFAFSGTFVALCDGFSYLILSISLKPLLASLVSGVIALVIGWQLTSKWVFGKTLVKANSKKNYLFLGFTNYLCGNIALETLLKINLGPILAKGISMMAVATISFTVQKLIIFRKSGNY